MKQLTINQLNQNTLTKPLLSILAGTVLIALASKIAVPLIGSPVPITLQSAAVLLVATVLGPVKGTLSVINYLLLGLSGAPLFAFGGGFIYLLGPTGGYLVGFIAAAIIAGYLTRDQATLTLPKLFIALIISSGTIFLFGLLWLLKFMTLKQALVAGVYPFMIGAGLKILLVASITPLLQKKYVQ